MTRWTRFFDLSSGGYEKEPFTYIYIEAAEEEAERIFTNRFGHDPQNITCACCGNDYSVREVDDIAAQIERDGDPHLIIRCDEIKPEERTAPWA